MKTKSLTIALIAGIFMLAFTSCEKQVTNAKIKVVETNITRLEKNYGNMTKTEFAAAYEDNMAVLDEIADGDVTKNQKKKVSDLKWRMRMVWIQYHNPFSEILKGDEPVMGKGLSFQFAVA